jgi:putative transposase
VVAEFHRKDIRLPTNLYRGRGMYFVTLCFHDRHRFGANPRLASWLIASLRKHAATCAFFVHAYCVMPDHIHLLAVGASEESNLIKFVESFKQETAVEFIRRTHCRLWQFKYYDRILRASDTADRVAWYIWLNPVRKGICRTPADYPFLGSFTVLGAQMLKGSVAREWTPPWKRAGTETPGAPESTTVTQNRETDNLPR